MRKYNYRPTIPLIATLISRHTTLHCWNKIHTKYFCTNTLLAHSKHLRFKFENVALLVRKTLFRYKKIFEFLKHSVIRNVLEMKLYFGEFSAYIFSFEIKELCGKRVNDPVQTYVNSLRHKRTA